MQKGKETNYELERENMKLYTVQPETRDKWVALNIKYEEKRRVESSG